MAPIDEALGVGIRLALSVDVEVVLASYMFTQMRAVNATYGTDEEPVRISIYDVLDFATLQGARVNGLDGVAHPRQEGRCARLRR